MNTEESPLYWSFPCGTWFQTQVRISVYFPLIVLVIAYQLKDFQLGLIFSGILFFSVLVHEFAHVAAARMTRGGGSEILIWPLGGLAYVHPAPTFSSQFLTPAAGPLVNLILCGITLPVVLAAGDLRTALNPVLLPQVALQQDLIQDLLVLLFCANWLLLLVNLIPVFPLDGGRMLQTCLAMRWGGATATEVYIRIGFFVAIIGMMAGMMADSTWIVLIGAFVLALNMRESFQMQVAEAYDESFMGYDFSQGYTSLEQPEKPRAERPPGFLKRWRERRRVRKMQQTLEKDAEIAREVDALLDKVHLHGIDALSDAEKRKLDRASARLRGKGKQID